MFCESILYHKKVFLIIIFCFVCISSINSTQYFRINSGNDFNFTPNLVKAYSEICKLKIEAAKQLLMFESEKNGIKILLEDYIDIITLLNNGTQIEYENMIENEGKRINKIDKLNSDSPYYRYIKAEINLHWMVIKYRFGDELSSARSFLRAYSLLVDNQKMHPDFIPQLKSIGTLNIILGSIPQNYNWVLKILGISGNIEKGLQEIKTASGDPIFGDEAEFYDFFIQSYLLGSIENVTFKKLLKFIDDRKDYLSVYFLGILVSVRSNQNELATNLLQNIPFKNEYLSMPILKFYQGEVELQKGNYSQAIESYNSYSKDNRSQIFQKETFQKLFYSYWLDNQSEKAMSALNEISKVGNTVSGADKFAQKFFIDYKQNDKLPNKSLVKARFFYDGGFYENAIKEIESIHEESLIDHKEKVEFHFKKGQIFFKKDKLEKAIVSFEKAIQSSQGKELSFEANSSLQLGYIYHLQGNTDRAKYYFEKAISFGNHEKKNVIEMRAKIALSKLG